MSDHRAINWIVRAVPVHVPIAREPPAAYGDGLAPPALELRPYTRSELWERFRGGEREADDCERWLATAARARAALDLAIAEGLAALRAGNRLAALGFHLEDYAREVLGIGERTALDLVRLARELRRRPLLRAAVRAGEVGFRAAQVVLPVAVGEAEPLWTELASRETVRALERRVAAARSGAEVEEEWGRVELRCKPEEREVIDAALEVAGRELPGSRRFEQLEAMAAEYLAEFPEPADRLREGTDGLFRSPRSAARQDRREAELEVETDRWAMLPLVRGAAAPELELETSATAAEVDARLRDLARLQRRWDEIVGYCAHIVRASRIYQLLGFANFGQYVRERLGLPVRAVEQRAALEARIWESPALREARARGLSYEKLRALSRLPEKELAAAVERARGATCIALRRALAERDEAQMRAAGKLAGLAPKRVASLVAAAIRAVRARLGRPVPAGTCLAIVAAHFLTVWGMPTAPKTVSQGIRERDLGMCTVPGCSHRATDAHHLVYRSHGGDLIDPANQTAVCEFHHHACIHAGYLRVYGQAPDGLTWMRGREVFRGGAE